MRRLYAFTTNLISHLNAGHNRDGLRGIISELRLIFTGKTYRGKVKVIDTGFAKYKHYRRIGDENLTLITRSSDGRKSQVHYGDNNPYNWMPKFIQMKLRARGDLPKNHKIKVGMIYKKTPPQKRGCIKSF